MGRIWINCSDFPFIGANKWAITMSIMGTQIPHDKAEEGITMVILSTIRIKDRTIPSTRKDHNNTDTGMDMDMVVVCKDNLNLEIAWECIMACNSRDNMRCSTNNHRTIIAVRIHMAMVIKAIISNRDIIMAAHKDISSTDTDIVAACKDRSVINNRK